GGRAFYAAGAGESGGADGREKSAGAVPLSRAVRGGAASGAAAKVPKRGRKPPHGLHFLSGRPPIPPAPRAGAGPAFRWGGARRGRGGVGHRYRTDRRRRRWRFSAFSSPSGPVRLVPSQGFKVRMQHSRRIFGRQGRVSPPAGQVGEGTQAGRRGKPRREK